MLIPNSFYLLFTRNLRLISGIAIGIFCLIVSLLFFYNRNHLLLFFLVYADVVCLAITIVVLTYRIYRINKHSNKRFNKQIFGLFLFTSIIPTLFMFAFALIFFEAGINNFFKTPISNVVQHSVAISNVYIKDLQNSFNEYVNVLSLKLINKKRDEIIQILKNDQLNNNFDFILFEIDANAQINIIYRTLFSSDIQLLLATKNLGMQQTLNGQTYEIEGHLVSVRRIDCNLFLTAMSQVETEILKHRENIKIANEQYMKLSFEKTNIKSSFVVLFIGVSLAIVLLSIFLGIIYSRKVLFPINKIMKAIKDLSDGNYKIFISLKKQHNEWDELVFTFNDMVDTINDSREKLAMLSKQSAWKDIARKMAHEIKNPLTPILLSAERLKRKFGKNSVVPPEIFNSCIDTIVRQANNINNLVKEFSDFARLPEPKPELNDLKKLLNENILMYSNSYPDITFKSNFNCEELIFKFDYFQINQVIANIIINAIHAITENIRETTQKVILVNCELNDDTVFITIEDSGIGFTDSVLKNALSPYYTTRKNGTGLGLAIVYKIMSDHGGQIILENSQVLQGAKVTLLLQHKM